MDYCTCFPEYWITWKGKYVYIGWMCKKHDDGCRTHTFYGDTWNNRLVGATVIATIATIACWVRYTKLMWRKI